MIVAQREVHDGTNRDGVGAVFVGDYHGLLGDAADAHDCGVGLIDDGKSEDGAELAGIGDGEGGAFNIVRFEFLGTGAFAEIRDPTLKAEEIEVAGIFEYGDNESPIERDCDTHVAVAVITNVVAIETRVDDGPLLQGNDRGAHEKWHEGEASAVALLESGFVFGAEVDDAGKVHLVHAMNVSAGTARLDHALSDDLAHVAHGDDVAGVGGGGCRARGRGLCAGCGGGLAALCGTREGIRAYTSRL